MTKSKIFHIYMNDKCIFYNLSEEKFQQTWETIQRIGECVPNLKFEFVELLEHEKNATPSY